jgi:hypothetical protein
MTGIAELHALALDATGRSNISPRRSIQATPWYQHRI